MRLIKFEVKETFIPLIGQIILYDKVLNRYSIHHYQLDLVSEDINFEEATKIPIVVS